jgi:DnaK suppressor protein
MTSDDQDKQAHRARLLALRESLNAQLILNREESRPVSLDESIGRLARMDRMQAQQIALEQARRLEQRLSRIEGALARLETGGFGECLSCGEDIEAKRLRSQPDVTFCLDCQRARE